MSLRALFRRLRAIVMRGAAAGESEEETQLAEIRHEVERGLDALRRAQDERVVSHQGVAFAPADLTRAETGP